jgi:hypothetical protein
MAPGPPLPAALSSRHMSLTWSDHRSNGAAIKSYRLWRKKCDDKEEEQYHDDSVGSHLEVKLRDVEWEPLSLVTVFDRAQYPKHARFPSNVDLLVRGSDSAVRTHYTLHFTGSPYHPFTSPSSPTAHSFDSVAHLTSQPVDSPSQFHSVTPSTRQSS